MRAIGLLRHGGPEVLEVVERPTPHAGPGEVRIRVRAATVNPADTLIRAGVTPIRQRGTEPVIPGLDVAGTIDEIGPGTNSRLAVGNRVMAMVNPTRPAGGGYAEWVVLPESWVVPAPAGASHAEAATLPMNGLTALHALAQLRLTEGSTLAVTGAVGAVGGFAVQLATAAGHRVLADAAPQDADLVASLGADRTVARGPGVADRFRALTADGVDGVVDTAIIGAPLLTAIRRGGSLAYVRGGADHPAFERTAATRGVTLVHAYVHDYDGRRDKLDLLRRLADEGRLSLRVADTFSPEHAARAHRLLAAGGVRGRLVIEW
ncbi:alcohol dehydrogenase [Micromonospora acroterricola]|uniref:Alcohol dehydrogenase n=1 Tax=Micromonospora acroterricola TaxID=2202421 RepID=A0A317D7P5_9ACTN|nr:NADP-dependent oxidoreductase [Micromonospora acroterricola]PWR10150.1 alcohol dehydrogenase [Micromonospora acroterricola]